MYSKPLYSITDAQQVGLLDTLPQSQTTIAVGYVKDPDVVGQMTRGFQHFVSSGQIWALLIGFMIGIGLGGVRRG